MGAPTCVSGVKLVARGLQTLTIRPFSKIPISIEIHINTGIPINIDIPINNDIPINRYSY